MRLYWRSVVGGAVGGVVVAMLVLSLFYGVLPATGESSSLPFILGGGLALGFLTSLFVIAATFVFRRELARRAAATVIASALAPFVGWTLWGVGTGLMGDWLFFVAYPVVGAAAGIVAGGLTLLIALIALARIEDGRSDSGGDGEGDGDDVSRSLEDLGFDVPGGPGQGEEAAR